MSARPVVDLKQPPGALETYRKAAFQRAHGQDRVPEKILRLSGRQPDVEQVADYAGVVGERLTSVLPPLYPHLLGFPLQMALMTDPASPFPAIGLVHVANEVTVVAPIPIGLALDVEVEMTAPKPHRRGRTIDLLARVSPTGSGDVVWRSVSTYLRRESTKGRPGSAAGEPVPSTPILPGPGAIWTLPGDLGRRYGAVSGDRNPIHLSALSAKAFGFPTAIAHGMWTAARSLAQLEGRLPDGYRTAIEFQAPIRLPGKVEFVDAIRKDGADFQVRARGQDRLHLVGSVTAL
jgi:acyl dehydratase